MPNLRSTTHRRFISFLFVLSPMLFANLSAQAKPSATVMNSHPWAAAVAIDAKGKLVLPGFTDRHIHFTDGSLGLTMIGGKIVYQSPASGAIQKSAAEKQ